MQSKLKFSVFIQKLELQLPIQADNSSKLIISYKKCQTKTDIKKKYDIAEIININQQIEFDIINEQKQLEKQIQIFFYLVTHKGQQLIGQVKIQPSFYLHQKLPKILEKRYLEQKIDSKNYVTFEIQWEEEKSLISNKKNEENNKISFTNLKIKNNTKQLPKSPVSNKDIKINNIKSTTKINNTKSMHNHSKTNVHAFEDSFYNSPQKKFHTKKNISLSVFSHTEIPQASPRQKSPRPMAYPFKTDSHHMTQSHSTEINQFKNFQKSSSNDELVNKLQILEQKLANQMISSMSQVIGERLDTPSKEKEKHAVIREDDSYSNESKGNDKGLLDEIQKLKNIIKTMSVQLISLTKENEELKIQLNLLTKLQQENENVNYDSGYLKKRLESSLNISNPISTNEMNNLTNLINILYQELKLQKEETNKREIQIKQLNANLQKISIQQGVISRLVSQDNPSQIYSKTLEGFENEYQSNSQIVQNQQHVQINDFQYLT